MVLNVTKVFGVRLQVRCPIEFGYVFHPEDSRLDWGHWLIAISLRSHFDSLVDPTRDNNMKVTCLTSWADWSTYTLLLSTSLTAHDKEASVKLVLKSNETP